MRSYKNIKGQEIDVDSLSSSLLVKQYRLFSSYYLVLKGMLSKQHIAQDKDFCDYVSSIGAVRDVLRTVCKERNLRLSKI
jgi:hypothetical protein